MTDQLLSMGLRSVHIDMHLDYLNVVRLLLCIWQVDRVLQLGRQRAIVVDRLIVFVAEDRDGV
jgi:hypothetical protein